MPPRLWQQRVEDILDTVAKIRRAIQERSFQDFAADDLLRGAVFYFFIVIGESAGALPASVQALAPAIPWRKIQGMRNRLIHEHFQISLPVVWSTVEQDLDDVEQQLRALLASVEGA